jgi:chromosome segregation ATPase
LQWVRLDDFGEQLACSKCEQILVVGTSLLIACPGCRRSLRVTPEFIGECVICNHCDHSFRLSKHMWVPCPGCGNNLRIRPQSMGRRVRCHRCDRGFRVTGPAKASTVAVALPLPKYSAGVRTELATAGEPPPWVATPLAAVAPPTPAADQVPDDLAATLEGLRAECERLREERQEASSELESIEARLPALERSLATAVEARVSAEKQRDESLAEARKRWHAERQALEARWQDELQAVIEDFERQLQQEQVECRAGREELEGERGRFEQAQKRFGDRVRALALELEEERRKRSVADQARDVLERLLEETHAEAGAQHERLRLELAGNAERLHQAHALHEELTGKISAGTLEEDALRARVAQLEQRLEESQEIHEKLETALCAGALAEKSLQSQVNEHQERHLSTEQTCRQLEAALAVHIRAEEGLQAHVVELEGQAREAQEAHQRLNEATRSAAALTEKALRTRVHELEQRLQGALDAEEISEREQQAHVLEGDTLRALALNLQAQLTEAEQAKTAVETATAILERERSSLAAENQRLQYNAMELTDERDAALARAQSTEEKMRAILKEREAEHRATEEMWEREHLAQVQAMELQARERAELLVEREQLRDQAHTAINERDRALERMRGLR